MVLLLFTLLNGNTINIKKENSSNKNLLYSRTCTWTFYQNKQPL